MLDNKQVFIPHTAIMRQMWGNSAIYLRVYRFKWDI